MNWTRNIRNWISGLALLLLAAQAHATAPTQFSVQGVLRNNAGVLQSMAISGTVKLWDAQNGGNQIGPNYAFLNVGVANGLFTVGVSDPALVGTVKGATNVWLELTVTGMGGAFPRQQVGSELFALEAATADSLNCSGCITDGNVSAAGISGTHINGAVAWTTGLQSGGTQVSISATAPTSGQVLEYNGTQWVPTSLGGSSGQFVDLVSSQSVGGRKGFTAPVSINPGDTSVAALTATMPSQSIASTTPAIVGFGAAGTGVSGTGARGISGVGGSAQLSVAGVGVDGRGGPNTSNGPGGIGVYAEGGTSASGVAGTGVSCIGGSSTFGTGGFGISASGGTGLNNTTAPAASFTGTVRMSPDLNSNDFIDFGNVGVAPPSNVSTGWKIKLYNGNAQYGLGIDGGVQWYSSGNRHRWYSTNGSFFTAQMVLDNTGQLTTGGAMIPNGTPDLAETIPATAEVSAADVACADPTHAERVMRCRRGDRAVLGVISDGSSALLINAHSAGVDARLTGRPLVLAGRVPVKVSLENGPIEIGDFLGPSSTPGVAMKLTDPGMGVGFALDSFDGKKGKSGTVLCFVKVGEHNVGGELKRLQAENAALRLRLDRIERLVSASGTGRDKWAVRASMRRGGE